MESPSASAMECIREEDFQDRGWPCRSRSRLAARSVGRSSAMRPYSGSASSKVGACSSIGSMRTTVPGAHGTSGGSLISPCPTMAVMLMIAP